MTLVQGISLHPKRCLVGLIMIFEVARADNIS
jgi:hypothetical protein